MSPVVTFSGKLGSGKTAVSKAFAGRMALPWTSFGTVAREIARERGLEESRPGLQALGETLVTKELAFFCERVWQAVGYSTDSIVIDGLRHFSVLQALRQLAAPRQLVCVYIEIDPLVRSERIKARDGVSEADIARLDCHSTEIEVSHLKDVADLISDNSGTLEESVSEIVSWWKCQTTSTG